MTSVRTSEANRRSALKSIGPKTQEEEKEEKAVVCLIALGHCLLSREVLLPGEDKDVLRELDERLRDELQPVGEPENLLVNRIVCLVWRLCRLGRWRPGYSPKSATALS